MAYKVEMQFSNGTTEVIDEVFETRAAAHKHGLYRASLYRQGGEIRHMSILEDYPLSDEEVGFTVIEVERVNQADDDIHVVDFARVLATLEPHLPISDQYEFDVPQRRGVWWTSQQEHMVRWFSEQVTGGAYTRSKSNTSARTAYNRLRAPAAFVWIAEALGENSAVVQDVADAARAEPNPHLRPGLLRRQLPWSRIAELARQRMKG